MAFLDLLRQLLQVTDSADDLHAGTAARAAELRDVLSEDPNDIAAFQELAEIVQKAAYSSASVEDPLTADAVASDPEEKANLALWSLAEELSARPNAWYPLIELARLSADSDIEGATRRLTTAVQRDDSGRALEESIKVLREAGHPTSGISLGIGYWMPKTQQFGAGEQLVIAAIDAQRPDIAAEHLRTLKTVADQGTYEAQLKFLSDLVDSEREAEEERLRAREENRDSEGQ